jgi:hypothetical protein
LNFDEARMTDITRFEIAKLELRHGDTLVVRTEQHLSKEQTAYIEAFVTPHIPDGCKVLVLGGGLQLVVLTVGVDPGRDGDDLTSG